MIFFEVRFCSKNEKMRRILNGKSFVRGKKKNPPLKGQKFTLKNELFKSFLVVLHIKVIMALDVVYRKSCDDWSCPTCGSPYNESQFRNLQKHCNRVHHTSLSKYTQSEKLTSQEKYKIKKKVCSRKAYRNSRALKLNLTSTKRNQCKFVTGTGQRCKLIAIGKTHCRFHVHKCIADAIRYGTFNDQNVCGVNNITVKKSTLPDKLNKDGSIKRASGKGVFATFDFQKGDFITEYSGHQVSVEQFQLEQYNRFYFLACPKSFGFAGLDGITIPEEEKGVGSFLNCGYNKSYSENYKKYPNNTRFHFCLQTKTAWIVATQFIPKHTELFIDYGPLYKV